MFAVKTKLTQSSGTPVVTPRKRVAVLLAGCGAKDGAEITESVSLLIALSQSGFEISMFAPDRPTAHTVDHLTESALSETRSILTEAARIARGNVRPISALRAEEFDALALPGGFGVAKNFCNFAFVGSDASLSSDIRDTLLEFMKSRKPVAALCIAPVCLALACRELGIKGAKITLGDGSAQDAVNAVTGWGAQHVACNVGEACVDEAHLLVSSPAYMHGDSTPADIFSSAQALVVGLRSLFLKVT